MKPVRKPLPVDPSIDVQRKLVLEPESNPTVTCRSRTRTSSGSTLTPPLSPASTPGGLPKRRGSPTGTTRRQLPRSTANSPASSAS